MMPNTPTLLRQFGESPPTLSRRLTAAIRAECGREQLSMVHLATMSGLSYHKVRKTLQDSRPLYIGELDIIAKSLGLDLVDLFESARSPKVADI